jgi:hypothetical protein
MFQMLEIKLNLWKIVGNLGKLGKVCGYLMILNKIGKIPIL